MKRMNKVLSVFLAVVMVVGILPISLYSGQILSLKALAANTSDPLELAWPSNSFQVATLYYYNSYSHNDLKHGQNKHMHLGQYGFSNMECYHIIDIGSDGGTEIRAAQSGTVTNVLSEGWHGNAIEISHNGGQYKTFYAHLSQVNVSKGQSVSKNQIIGTMGSTGTSTGTHLHFECSLGDAWADHYVLTYANQIYYDKSVYDANNRDSNVEYSSKCRAFIDFVDNYCELKSDGRYHSKGKAIPIKSNSSVNSDYPTNFQAIAKVHMDVFNDKNGKRKAYGHYIDANDPCTIIEVYNTGYCKVSYPTSSGYCDKYYADINNFEIEKKSTVSVTMEGNSKSNMVAKYLVYPTWLYPGCSDYTAYSGVVTSNKALSSVKVSITASGKKGIVKEWKANGENVKVVSFVDKLPISAAEFAGLEKGTYTFKVQATCVNATILGISFNSLQKTLFEAKLVVSETEPSGSGTAGVQKKYNSANVIDVSASETGVNTESNSGNSYYNGSSSYPLGSYTVRVNTRLRARTGPSTNYKILTSLNNGTVVDVTATNGNWGYTSYGWICLDYTTYNGQIVSEYNEPVYYETGKYIVTNTDGLNARTGPDTSYDVKYKVPFSIQFSVTETSGAWGYSPDYDGWLCLLYADYIGALEPSLPRPAMPQVRCDTASMIAVGDIVSVSWDAVEYAETYTAQLIDANSGAVVETKADLYSTSVSFATPYEGKFNVMVAGVNSQHNGDRGGVFGIETKAPSTVTFKDWDGTVLATQTVAYRKDAVLPVNPTRTGYTFKSWSGRYTEVEEDTVVTATYTRNSYTVRFYDHDGTTLVSTQSVLYGDAATAPTYSAPTGYSFVRWDKDFSKITGDTNVTAVVSWTSQYPLEISTTSSVVRNNTAYITTAIVNNSPNAVSNAKVIMALKTQEDKQLAYVESNNFSMAKGEVKTINLTATYDGASTVANIFVVQNNNEKIPVSNQLNVNVDQGTAWSAWSTSTPPANALQTQSRTEYQYRDKSYTTSTSFSLSGWTRRTDVNPNPSTSYGNWGGWSAWQDSAVSSSDTVDVKTQTVQSGYTGWSGWSGWQDSWVGSNDLTDVETQQVVDQTIYRTEYTYQTMYHYYRYSTGWTASGGSDKPTSKYGTTRYEHVWDHEMIHLGTMGNYSQGYRHYYETADGNTQSGHYITVWKDDPFTTQEVTGSYQVVDHYTYKTQYRYRTRNYTYKTQYSYRTRSKTLTYYYEKWGDWSNWSTTKYTASSTRGVNTRTTYRYISNISANIEDVTGITRTISGMVDTTYKDKHAILCIKSADGTVQYIGQTKLDGNGTYSFTFKLKNDPTEQSGDYNVTLSIEGTNAAMELDPILAPVPTYTVTFKSWDGTVLSTQEVTKGENAEMPEAPDREGYDFVHWSDNATNVTADLTITPVYEQKTFEVVFVDDTYGTTETKTFSYGDPLVGPKLEDDAEYTFVGWDAILDGVETVTENMVLNAVYEKNTYTVTYLDHNENVIATEEVEYGDAPVAPDEDGSSAITFVDWESVGDTNFVTCDTTVRTVFYYNETVETPEISLATGAYDDEQTVTIDCATEGATIYYTLDGTDPMALLSSSNPGGASFAPARRASAKMPSEAENGLRLYTGPFTLADSAELVVVAVKDEMAQSDYEVGVYSIHTASSETNKHLVTLHYGLDDIEESFLVEDGEPFSDYEDWMIHYGYSLRGIYLDEAMTQPFNIATTAITDNIDLYFDWVKNVYTVTFLNANGDELSEQEVAYNEDAVAPDIPDIEGKIFTGWDSDYTNVSSDLIVTATYADTSVFTMVSLNKAELNMEVGETADITATVTLANDSDNAQLIWQSTNDTVAKVDDNGHVSAVSAGTATVFAISEDSGFSASCDVTVEGLDPCKNGHVIEVIPGYPASCLNAGYTDGCRCSICKTVLSEPQIIQPTGHLDNDGNGLCDACGANVGSDGEMQESNCACGKYHTGPFAGLIKFVHRIVYFFKNLFGKN